MEHLKKLASTPAPLLEFLAKRRTNNRLGRYFENLLQYYLTHLREIETLHTNLQVRTSSKRTLGEFDLIFKNASESIAQHWEASVKFYICLATDPEKARLTRYYLGTLVHDRLDRKLKKFFEAQLRLSEVPEGRDALVRLGLSSVEPRALLKGYLYYPAEASWMSHPSPPEISPHHERGWWLTADRLEDLPFSETSMYVVLPFARWLSRMNGWVTRDLPLTRPELRTRVARLFDSSWARPLNYEMMVAEVRIVEEQGAFIHVEERSRGNILHPGWPRHALASLDAML